MATTELAVTRDCAPRGQARGPCARWWSVLTRKATTTPPSQGRRRAQLTGLLTCILLTAVATLAGRFLPLIGPPVIAILGGALLATAAGPRRRQAWAPVLPVASRWGLQIAVVLLGVHLSLGEVARTGGDALPVTIGTLLLCLGAAVGLGRLLGVHRDLRTLIGVGTAVCGASAIAAVTPVLRPAGSAVAYALSTVFVFNIVAVIAFPPLGYALGLSDAAFGVLAGTAVNDMSSVVAAAGSYSPEAAHTAVVVKLSRTLAIIPICLVLAALVARRDRAGRGSDAPRPVWRLVPWFLVAFVVVAGLNSLSWIPSFIQGAAGGLSSLLITAALGAIGLATDLPALRRAGPAPLLLGGVLWLVVTGGSLGLQALLGP
ncbi:YeiH family protein [Ruania halotolerans]|uniref:YeiH family protein n=1 Tax=Ruania halotolerans TaxID=2897773 RepID=UPI001E48EEAA|nr:putative sulfate exporter family transporter [Ruania halotolerans]UFU07324.1 putative sulfate exporter family transporter [Ruania halotolerans]